MALNVLVYNMKRVMAIVGSRIAGGDAGVRPASVRPNQRLPKVRACQVIFTRPGPLADSASSCEGSARYRGRNMPNDGDGTSRLFSIDAATTIRKRQNPRRSREDRCRAVFTYTPVLVGVHQSVPCKRRNADRQRLNRTSDQRIGAHPSSASRGKASRFDQAL